MPVVYPIPPEAEQNWDAWRQALMQAIRVIEPGGTAPPTMPYDRSQDIGVVPQRPQTLPEMMAGILVEPSMKEAVGSGILGMGPMVLGVPEKVPGGPLTTSPAKAQTVGSAPLPEPVPNLNIGEGFVKSEIVQPSSFVHPPISDIWNKPSHLVKTESMVTVRGNLPQQMKTFEVSIHPEELAKFPDLGSPIEFKNPLEAAAYNKNETRWLDWQNIYAGADKIEKLTDAQKEAAGKLFYMSENAKKPIPIVSLTRGCQRGRTTAERVENGVLPNETRVEACYGGDCWANTQFNNKFSTFENMEVRDLQIANADTVRSWFEGKELQNNRNFIKKISDPNVPFIRMGQEGCDSHIIANGAAEAWLEGMAKIGAKPKTVMISAAYAPVSDAQYQALAKYADKFELHFSVSGWFHPNELSMRMGEFLRAREAGVPAKLRIITNKDNISGINMVNEPLIDKWIKEYNIQPHEILETPFHDDTLKRVKGKPQDRSRPTEKYPYVCCEDGWCGGCKFKCLTDVSPRGNMPVATSIVVPGAFFGGLFSGTQSMEGID